MGLKWGWYLYQGTCNLSVLHKGTLREQRGEEIALESKAVQKTPHSQGTDTNSKERKKKKGLQIEKPATCMNNES